MKKAFWVLLNKVFRKDLEILYGEGSYVEIRDVIFSTNKKIYVISCILKIGDSKLYEEIGETGLNFLFEESWRYMGFYDKKFLLQISFELT
jgi:hypothetical protein